MLTPKGKREVDRLHNLFSPLLHQKRGKTRFGVVSVPEISEDAKKVSKTILQDTQTELQKLQLVVPQKI